MPPVPPALVHPQDCSCISHLYARTVGPALDKFTDDMTDENWAIFSREYKNWRIKVEAEFQRNTITISRLERTIEAGMRSVEIVHLEEVIGALEEQTGNLSLQYEELKKEKDAAETEKNDMHELASQLREENKGLQAKLIETQQSAAKVAEETIRQIEKKYGKMADVSIVRITELESRVDSYEQNLARSKKMSDELASFEAENHGLMLRLKKIEDERAQEVEQMRQELQMQYEIKERELLEKYSRERIELQGTLQTEIERLKGEREANHAILEEAKGWQPRIARVKAEEAELEAERRRLAGEREELVEFREAMRTLNSERREDILTALKTEQRKKLEAMLDIEAKGKKISSGFARLDDILFGGFPWGTSAMVTGEDGKDIVYGFIADAIHKGAQLLLIPTAQPASVIKKRLTELLPNTPLEKSMDIYDAYSENAKFENVFVFAKDWLAAKAAESKTIRPRIVILPYEYSAVADVDITSITGKPQKVSLQRLRDLVDEHDSAMLCAINPKTYASRGEEWAKIEDTFACQIRMAKKRIDGGQMDIRAQFALRMPAQTSSDAATSAILGYRIRPIGIELMPALGGVK